MGEYRLKRSDPQCDGYRHELPGVARPLDGDKDGTATYRFGVPGYSGQVSQVFLHAIYKHLKLYQLIEKNR
jgi:hypothetical protein